MSTFNKRRWWWWWWWWCSACLLQRQFMKVLSEMYVLLVIYKTTMTASHSRHCSTVLFLLCCCCCMSLITDQFTSGKCPAGALWSYTCTTNHLSSLIAWCPKTQSILITVFNWKIAKLLMQSLQYDLSGFRRHYKITVNNSVGLEFVWKWLVYAVG